MSRARDVLDQVLDLPVRQRARIAHELIASLDDAPAEDSAEVAKAWDDEIARRLQEVDSGTADLVPWSVAEKEIKADLAKLRRRARIRKPRRKPAR
jgi:hypothetical protein